MTAGDDRTDRRTPLESTEPGRSARAPFDSMNYRPPRCAGRLGVSYGRVTAFAWIRLSFRSTTSK